MDEQKRQKRNEYMRKWTARNKERVNRERRARQTPETLEMANQKKKAWYQANKERARATENARYHANKKLRGYVSGQRSPNWKGDNASYSAIHYWVSRHRGKPQECERCGTTKAKKYEWANISQQYKRDFSDWVRLCVPCHSKYDRAHQLSGYNRKKLQAN